VVQAVDKAAKEALRAGEIIRRLRDFVSRGETDRRVESLPKLLEEACALALVGAKEHGIKVRFNLSPDVDLALVDRVQIQQVILNLVRNAVDAMADSEQRELTVGLASDAGDMALITVVDSGCGIHRDVADQLFKPFVTTKRTGMGVGLSICRTIVEAHGGKIWVAANVDGGTTFRFTVPSVSKQEACDVE